MSFVDELARRIASGRAAAVVGLDPRLDALPADCTGTPGERIVAFYRDVLPRIAPHAVAVKPNVAFFEAFGPEGFAAYDTTCRLARAAGLLVIGDIKRGDIGTTAAAYARYHLDVADAVTLHPWLGSDSVAPFVDRCRSEGKALFILVRTSNPSAHELQDLPTGGGTVAEAVAAVTRAWGEGLGAADGYSPIGAVIGATRPAELPRWRALLPRAWLLLPGVGAQGGTTAALAPAFDAQGRGALVTQSRGILQSFAPDEGDWRERVAEAARAFAAEVRDIAGSHA